jgi:hypothetical protein
MNEAMFLTEIDRWINDVRAETLRLFSDGVPSERCLGIATAIADAKAINRAVSRQKLTPGSFVRAPQS